MTTLYKKNKHAGLWLISLLFFFACSSIKNENRIDESVRNSTKTVFIEFRSGFDNRPFTLYVNDSLVASYAEGLVSDHIIGLSRDFETVELYNLSGDEIVLKLKFANCVEEDTTFVYKAIINYIDVGGSNDAFRYSTKPFLYY